MLVHPDMAALGAAVASRFLVKVLDLLDEQPIVHVAVAGGSVATNVLTAVAEHGMRSALDWQRVHVWWVDERFVDAATGERNDELVIDRIAPVLGIPRENLHPMGSPTEFATVDDAADAYERELARWRTDDSPVAAPSFDVVLLGVGPDGHVASLFPGLPAIQERERTAVAVHDAPKPPPERISLTLPVLNAAARVYVVLSGSEKASALGLALAGAHRSEVPVAGVKGRRRTVFFVDAAAATEVPQELIAREY